MQQKFKMYQARKVPLQQQPFMTYLFLAITILVYVYTYVTFGTTTHSLVLIKMGAKVNPLMIYNNEWWRLVTAAFIHIGFQHILMNGITLYFLGQELERIMGHVRFTIVYLVSAVGGNIVSFAFSDSISAGASTSLFGIFVSFIVLSAMYPRSQVLKQRASTYTILIVLNIALGLFNQGIDNWGHMGGAAFGAIITFALGLSVKSHYTLWQRLIAAAIGVIIAAGLIFYGINRY